MPSPRTRDAIPLDARVLLDLGGATLCRDERLGDGVIQALLFLETLLHGLDLRLGLLGTCGRGRKALLHDLELASQLALDEVSLLELVRRRKRLGICLGKLAARLCKLVLGFLELGFQVGDLLVHRIDLVGDALEEHVDLTDVVSAQGVLEPLVLDVLHCDGHV